MLDYILLFVHFTAVFIMKQIPPKSKSAWNLYKKDYFRASNRYFIYSSIFYQTVLFTGQWRFPPFRTESRPLLPDPHGDHGFLHSGAEAAGIPAAGLGVQVQCVQRL